MAKSKIITAERLRQVRRYNPDTGQFFLFKRMANRWEPTGGWHNAGYIRLTVDWQEYLAHNLAWLYMTSKYPDWIVDHINLDKADNRWCNLRLAVGNHNRGNIGLISTNTNGFTGTYYIKNVERWKAQICNEHLGLFTTQAEAYEAYAAAVREKYGEFAHERFKNSALLPHKER